MLCYVGMKKARELGCAKGENGHHVDPSFPRLEEGISCACGCVRYFTESSTDIGR